MIVQIVQGRPGPGSAATAAAAALMGGGPVLETAFETLLSPLQWKPGGGIHPPASSAAAPTPAGGSGSAAAAAGPSGAGAAHAHSGAAAGAAGAGSTPPAGAGGAPALPVSSSAAAGYPASAAGPGAAAGVGSPLPPFLASFLRPRLRASLCCPGGAVLALPHEAVLPMAHVWLRGSHEWAQLLPYHRGQLMVLCLLHDGPPPAPEVLAALAAVLGRGAAPAVAALAAELPGRAGGSSSVWHEKGHRYCYTDSLCHASRYTPLKKVLTLSASALRHLAHLRSKMDEWEGQQAGAPHGQRRGLLQGPGGSEQQQQGGDATQQPNGAGGAGSSSSAASEPPPLGAPCGEAQSEAEAELVVRTGRDAWLVLRAAPGGRRLYTVVEPAAPELALAAAAAPTDALCDRLFPGVFLQP